MKFKRENTKEVKEKIEIESKLFKAFVYKTNGEITSLVLYRNKISGRSSEELFRLHSSSIEKIRDGKDFIFALKDICNEMIKEINKEG